MRVGEDAWLGIGHEMQFLQSKKYYWHTFYTVDSRGKMLVERALEIGLPRESSLRPGWRSMEIGSSYRSAWMTSPVASVSRRCRR